MLSPFKQGPLLLFIQYYYEIVVFIGQKRSYMGNFMFQPNLHTFILEVRFSYAKYRELAATFSTWSALDTQNLAQSMFTSL